MRRGNNRCSVIPSDKAIFLSVVSSLRLEATVCRPSSKNEGVNRKILTFRELELGACAFLTIFFPLFHARITGQKA